MPRLLSLLVFAVLSALFCLDCAAQTAVAGHVAFIEGDVRFVDATQQTRRPAKGDELKSGDTIVTGRDGEVHLEMQDSGYLAVRPNTRLKIVDYRADGGKDDRSIIDLVVGTFRSITGWIPRVSPKGYRVTMTTATLGIRGTDHEPLVIPPGSDLGEAGAYDKVNAGATVLESPSGSVDILPDTAGFAPDNADERPRVLLKIPDIFRSTLNEHLMDGRHQAVQDQLQQRLDARRQLLERTNAPDASPRADPPATPDAAPPADQSGIGVPKAPLPAAAGAATAGAAALAAPATAVVPPLQAPPPLPSPTSMKIPGAASAAKPTAAPVVPATRGSTNPEPAPAAPADQTPPPAAPAAKAAKPAPAGVSARPVAPAPPPVAPAVPSSHAAEEDRASRLKQDRDARHTDRQGQYERDRERLRERGAPKPADPDATPPPRRY